MESRAAAPPGEAAASLSWTALEVAAACRRMWGDSVGKGCSNEIRALSCTTKKEMRPFPAGYGWLLQTVAALSLATDNFHGIADPSRSLSTITNMTTNLVDDLRKKAEALLAMAPNAAGMLPVDNVKELLHELQVHQIELELQNEELRNTRNALEESQIGRASCRERV